MTSATKITGGTIRGYYCYHHRPTTNGNAAASRLDKFSPSNYWKSLSNTTLPSDCVAGRAPPDDTRSSRGYRRHCYLLDLSPPQLVRQPLLAEAEGRSRRHSYYFSRISGRLHHERQFSHTSPSTGFRAATATMSSTTTTASGQPDADAAAANGEKSSASSSWIGHRGAAAFDLRSEFLVLLLLVI